MKEKISLGLISLNIREVQMGHIELNLARTKKINDLYIFISMLFLLCAYKQSML